MTKFKLDQRDNSSEDFDNEYVMIRYTILICQPIVEKNSSFLVKIDNGTNIHVPLLDQNAEFCSQRKFKLIGVQYVVTWNFVLSPSGFKET